MMKSVRCLYHAPLEPNSELKEVITEMEGHVFQQLINVYTRKSADICFSLFINYISNSVNDFPEEIKRELDQIAQKKSIPKDIASVARFGKINQALKQCDAFLREFGLQGPQEGASAILLERIRDEIFSLVQKGSSLLDVRSEMKE